jgi:hypothetical protein
MLSRDLHTYYSQAYIVCARLVYVCFSSAPASLSLALCVCVCMKYQAGILQKSLLNVAYV